MKRTISTILIPLIAFLLVACEDAKVTSQDTGDIVDAYVKHKNSPLYEGVSSSEGLTKNEAGALLVLDNFYLALQKRDFEHLRYTISPHISTGVDEVIAYYKDKITSNNITIDRFKVMTIELGSSSSTSTDNTIIYTVEVKQTFSNQTTLYKDRVELRKTDNQWGISAITTTVADSG